MPLNVYLLVTNRSMLGFGIILFASNYARFDQALLWSIGLRLVAKPIWSNSDGPGNECLIKSTRRAYTAAIAHEPWRRRQKLEVHANGFAAPDSGYQQKHVRNVLYSMRIWFITLIIRCRLSCRMVCIRYIGLLQFHVTQRLAVRACIMHPVYR